jgi:hypothetical protein
MSSELKSETARINGAKSHGPVTPEGKATSSANSRRHGLTASALLEGESNEDLQLLLADFMDQFQPQTGVETDLVEVMAIARWRLRRLLAIETNLFELEMVRRQKQINADFKGIDQQGRLAFVFQKMSDTGNSLTLLIRYEGSLNRSYDKALKHLLELQKSRRTPPSSGPLGSFGIFEPKAASTATGVDKQHPNPIPEMPCADNMRSKDDQNIRRRQIPVNQLRLVQVSTAAPALAPPFLDLPGYKSDIRSRAHSRCIRDWPDSSQSSCAARTRTCGGTPVPLRTQGPKLTAAASHV